MTRAAMWPESFQFKKYFLFADYADYADFNSKNKSKSIKFMIDKLLELNYMNNITEPDQPPK